MDFKTRCRRANERADIVSVAEALRLDVDTRGRVPVALCPFHGDAGRKNLTFYQEPGDRGALVPRAYCFTCKTLATALDLVSHMQKCDIFEALDWLERLLGIQEGEAAPVVYTPRVARPAPPQKDKSKALAHAIRRLWDEAEGKEARAYLESRALIDIAREYRVGYWGTDQSGWSGRIVIPYLASLEPDDPVFTMVGRSFQKQAKVDGQRVPKYLYTSAASRQPYLWEIAMERASASGYLFLAEGELDGLSVLAGCGSNAPVAALGGVGAISSIALDTRVAGLELIYIADTEAEPRYGTEDEQKDLNKLAAIDKAIGENIWKLTQLNANVRLIHPPSISVGGKTDVNDLLIAYGPEYIQDWLMSEVEVAMGSGSRSLL